MIEVDETAVIKATETAVIETAKVNQEVKSHVRRCMFYDPRPDLGTGEGQSEGRNGGNKGGEAGSDSILWTILLELAYDIDPELYGRLHGMRCQGTILKKSRRWGYIMQPIIDPEGCTGWVSRREYDEEKRKWLDPFREDVIGLLGKI